MKTTFAENNKYYEPLNQILDPDTGIGIADMGLIYKVRKHGNILVVTMTLTSMGCPAGPYFIEEIEKMLGAQPGINDVQVEIVWEPAWTPDNMKPELREMLFGF